MVTTDKSKIGYRNEMFKIIAVKAINHLPGTHVNAKVPWFSLRLDGADPHAIVAIEAYAASCKELQPVLSDDLRGIARRVRERNAISKK